MKTLGLLLDDCRFGKITQRAIAPFVWKGAIGKRIRMLQIAGIAWLLAHELAHTSEKNASLRDVDVGSVHDSKYLKEELAADLAALRVLIYRSIAKLPDMDEERRIIFVGFELMLHTFDIISASNHGDLKNRHERADGSGPLSIKTRFEELSPLISQYFCINPSHTDFLSWRKPYIFALEVAIQRIILLESENA